MAVNLNQTLLGPKTVIQNNSLIVDEKLIIEGRITAKKIDAGKHPIIIGDGADVSVEEDLTGSEIIVLGKLKGNIKATHEIVVSQKGSVDGNLTAPKIKLDPTASVTGVLRH
ncbi:MAG: polymer-forming cytoskeletal protein [Leptonema sp. (in: Bacteria)]|nr:polymer-forming cytoskeletal protein [Leptonema sp. (in: bacteria)]